MSRFSSCETMFPATEMRLLHSGEIKSVLLPGFMLHYRSDSHRGQQCDGSINAATRASITIKSITQLLTSQTIQDSDAFSSVDLSTHKLLLCRSVGSLRAPSSSEHLRCGFHALVVIKTMSGTESSSLRSTK